MASALSLGEVVDVYSAPPFSLVYSRYPPGAKLRVHFHEVATLQVVCRGAVVERVSGMRFDLGEGCAVYKPAGIRHSDAYSSGAECLLIGVPESIFAHEEVIVETTSRAWSMNLIQEIRAQKSGWDLAVSGFVMLGLARLRRLSAASVERPDWLDEARSLARQQEGLGTIADRIGRHPSHIAREFRRHEGVSVGEFARRCRLELAARALRAGDANLSELALTAGFCDQSHFTRAFHRVFGVTPGQYRKTR